MLEVEGVREGEGVGGAEDRVVELERTLEETRAALDAVERRHRIDLALIDAEAADLETARIMTEAAVASMGSGDVAAVVADLRRRKPFLFRARRSAASAAMGPRAGGPSAAAIAADEAARTGDRSALLRYLRAKREGM